MVAKMVFQGGEQFGPDQCVKGDSSNAAPPAFDLNVMKDRWDELIRRAFSQENFLPTGDVSASSQVIKHLWPLWALQRQQEELLLSKMLFAAAHRIAPATYATPRRRGKGSKAPPLSARVSRAAVSYVIGYIVMRLSTSIAAFDYDSTWVTDLLSGVPAKAISHLMGAKRPRVRDA